jgi:hypothetical protein
MAASDPQASNAVLVGVVTSAAQEGFVLAVPIFGPFGSAPPTEATAQTTAFYT